MRRPGADLNVDFPECWAYGLGKKSSNGNPKERLIEYKDPGRYIPIIFLLYSWGSHQSPFIRVLGVEQCSECWARSPKLAWNSMKI